jgi:hypothetical protein
VSTTSGSAQPRTYVRDSLSNSGLTNNALPFTKSVGQDHGIGNNSKNSANVSIHGPKGDATSTFGAYQVRMVPS